MNLLSRGVDLSVGATRWLGTAGIAVLLAPVLPDLAVDIFGDPTAPARDWWLRLLALAFLIALVLGLTAANLRWTARRTRRRGRDPFADLRPAEVLAVSLSLGKDNTLPYTRIDRRAGPGPQIVEFLAAGTTPTTVVGVISPQVDQTTVDSLTAEFAADGIGFTPVRISEAYEPHAVIGESRGIADTIARLDVPGSQILVDTTAGTIPMTLAMMRVAATLGAPDWPESPLLRR